jgi:hypothetical protein
MKDAPALLIALATSLAVEMFKTIREAQKTWSTTMRLLCILLSLIAAVAVALHIVLPD